MPLALRLKIFFVGTLLVSYLLWTPGVLDETYVGRFAWLSLMTLGAGVAILPHTKASRVNVLDLTFLLFYLLSLASLLWADLPSAGYLTVQSVLLAFTCYVCFRLFSREVSDRFVFRLLIVVSIVTLLLAGWQIVQVGLSEGLGDKNIYKVLGNSGHKNLLASFLFLLFGFNLLQALCKGSNPWIYSLLAIQVLTMLLLRTRAVFFALFALFMIVGIYLLFSNSQSRKLLLGRLIPLLTGGLIVGAILFFTLGGSQKDWRQLNPAEYLHSSSATERLFVWYKTSELIKDKPITGYGAGNWKLIFPSKSISGGYRLQTHNVAFTRVHNDYLEVWAELGIVGFLLYLGIFAWAFWAIIYGYKKAPPALRRELVILSGILLGYMVIAFFDFPKERFEHQVLLALLLAWIVEKTPDFFLRKHLSWPISTKQYLGFIIVIGLLLLANLPLSYFQIKGEAHSLKALVAQSNSQWPIVEKESHAAYSPFYQVSPLGLSVKWLEGLALYHQGDYQKSEKAFTLAIQQTPYHTRLLNDYGSCLVQLHDYEKAVEIYLKLMYINPKFEDGMFNLAFVYTQLHQFDEALDWVNKTEHDPQKKAEFIQEIGRLRTAFEQDKK